LIAPDGALLRASEVARGLVGETVEIYRHPAGGRNSRIWRVRGRNGEYALKQYPSRRDDPRDRLSTEVSALRLMERYGIDRVPRVLGIDSQRGYVLMSWIEGSEVSEVTNTDIDGALGFLSAVHTLRATAWAVEQPLASEACLSGLEIERQINARLARLRSLESEPELLRFIQNSLASTVIETSRQVRAKVAAAGLDFRTELSQNWRSLIPADFGFHNSLRRSDGSLAFVDFDYFGWDDPVKLAADILLHPGNTLSATQRSRFRQGALALYGDDLAFAGRLQAYLPLFGLRWVLILLNEFIPERWQRRVAAGDRADWSASKSEQLSRAREFLAALPDKLED
jgi:hypothetical protein